MSGHRCGRLVVLVVLAVFGAGPSGVRAAGPVGESCYELACRAQDAPTVGGSAFGHGGVGGYAGNHGGSCVGHDCQAGNGGTSGGNCYGDRCLAGNGYTGGGSCYGDRCRAGDADNVGGDCYGADCVPGKGGGRDGKAYPALPERNVECLLGLVYKVPKERNMVLEHLHWYATSAAHCGPIVKAVTAPETLPAVKPRKALPARRDPRCPYTCQGWDEELKSCVGLQLNGC